MLKIYDFLRSISDWFRIIFYNDEGKVNIFGKILAIALVLIIIYIIKKYSTKFANKILTQELKSKQPRKYLTISSILGNALKYILYFIGVVQILNILGVKTQSILATAGIGGMAIGFGAQSVIKDLISGMFIMTENQFEVGDHVIINNIEGKVTEFGMKTTSIRSFDGALNTMNNGSIQLVTNKSRGAQRFLVEIRIAYVNDLDMIKTIVRKVSKEIENESKFIVQAPYLLGITDLNASFMTITIVGRSNPEQFWTVERQIREKILKEFNEAGIKYLDDDVVIA